MTAPYGNEGFNSGSTPPAGTYLNPASVAPVVDAEAAVNAALARREALEAAAQVPNMSNPGTHAGPIGMNDAGTNSDM